VNGDPLPPFATPPNFPGSKISPRKVSYRLTDDEVAMVGEYVAGIAASAAMVGRPSLYEPDHGTLHEAQMRGFGAELALARLTGLAWPHPESPIETRGIPDLGVRLEVRSTRNDRRPSLHIGMGEKGERAYALMLNRPDGGWLYEFLGWCWGWEASESGSVVVNHRGTAHRIDARYLRPWPIADRALEERP
jgi:hypothetical protein